MTANNTGNLAGLIAAIALVLAACSSPTGTGRDANEPLETSPTAPGVAPDDEPSQSADPADPDGVPVPADGAALAEEAGEDQDPPLALDLPTPTPLPESPAPTTSAPASAAVPDDREAPEEPFTSDEAAALACANLENALRALETGDLDTVQVALGRAGSYVDSTESDQLRSLAAAWADVDDLAVAEASVWDALGVCEQLGYSL